MNPNDFIMNPVELQFEISLRQRRISEMYKSSFDPNKNPELTSFVREIMNSDEPEAKVFDLPWKKRCVNVFLRQKQSYCLILRYFELSKPNKVCVVTNTDRQVSALEETYRQAFPDGPGIHFKTFTEFFKHSHDYKVIFVNKPNNMVLLEWIKAIGPKSIYIINNKYTDTYDYVCQIEFPQIVKPPADTVLECILREIEYLTKKDKVFSNIVVYASKPIQEKLCRKLFDRSSKYPIIPQAMMLTENSTKFIERLKMFISSGNHKHYYVPIILNNHEQANSVVNNLPNSISAIIFATNATFLETISQFFVAIDTNTTSITRNQVTYENSATTQSEMACRQVFPTKSEFNAYINVPCKDKYKNIIPLVLPEIQQDRLISFMNGENQITLIADLIHETLPIHSTIEQYADNPNMCIFATLLFHAIEEYNRAVLYQIDRKFNKHFFDESSDLITLLNIVKHDLFCDPGESVIYPQFLTRIKARLSLFCLFGRTDEPTFLQFLSELDIKTAVIEVIDNFIRLNPEYINSHTLTFVSVNDGRIMYKKENMQFNFRVQRLSMPYLALSTTCVSFGLDEKMQTATLIHCTSPQRFKAINSRSEAENQFFAILVKKMISDCVIVNGYICIDSENAEANQSAQNALAIIRGVMPFFPRSVLIRNLDIGFYYEIISNGADESVSHVFIDQFPYAYAITKELLIWAAGKPNEFAKIEPNVRFAIASDGIKLGSKFSNNLTFAETEVFRKSESILLLSSDPIDEFAAQSLAWIAISGEDKTIFSMNRIAPRYITAKKIPVLAMAPSTAIKCKNTGEIKKFTLTEIFEYLRNNSENAKTFVFSPSQNLKPKDVAARIKNEFSKDIKFQINPSGLVAFIGCDMEQRLFERKCNLAHIYDTCNGYFSCRGEFISLKITHRKSQGIDQTIFNAMLQKILSSFGNSVHSISRYQVVENNPSICGFIKTMVITNSVALQITKQLKEVFHIDNYLPLFLPGIPQSFFYYKPTHTIIEKWINDNQSTESFSMENNTDYFEFISVYSVIVANCCFSHKNLGRNGKRFELLGNNYLTINGDIPRTVQATCKPGVHPLASNVIFPDMNAEYYYINQYAAIVLFPDDCNPNVQQYPQYIIHSGRATHIRIIVTQPIQDIYDMKNKLEKEVGYNKVLIKDHPNTVDILFLNKYDIRKVSAIIRHYIPSFNPINHSKGAVNSTVSKVLKHYNKFLSTNEEALRLQNILNAHPIEFGYVAVSMIGHVTVRMKIKCEWYYDKYCKELVVPAADKDEAEQFRDSLPMREVSEDDYIFCIGLCDPYPTSNELTIYNQDGTTESNYMCSPCIVDALQHSLGAYIDDPSLITTVTERPLYLASIRSTLDYDTMCTWPQVPLGQLIWSMCSDTKIIRFVQLWISVMMHLEINTSKAFFTFCPDHPQTIFTMRPDIKCEEPGCGFYLCNNCHQWHKKGQCVEWEGHRCPKCHAPSIKNGGCNHISCPCGCHWCYACPIGHEFHDTSAARVYGHMTSAHGSYYT